MSKTNLEQRLISAARQNPPGDHVPYAFEKRIMACIKDLKPVDHGLLWARALWRAAAPCVAIMLLLLAWSALSPSGDTTNDLSQDLDNTVLAAVDADNSLDSTW